MNSTNFNLDLFKQIRLMELKIFTGIKWYVGISLVV